jgi:hypothetical protein
MLPRRIALLCCALLIGASAVSAQAEADPVDDACAGASPTASVCIGGKKLRQAPAAVAPDTRPEAAGLAAYEDSWVHRTAAFQFALGDTVALRDAQWLGTHNSFNAPVNGLTPSHVDSNQQLTLTEQLDGDVRSIELDVHYIGGVARVCHGRGEDQLHAGCTVEDDFATVLREVRDWIDSHPDQVLLVYLEDHLGADGHAAGVAALDEALGPRVYKAGAPEGECRELPLSLTRAAVRAANANVILVGHCEAGWGSHVFGWDEAHDESGSNAGYTCAGPSDKLVRYFEDSTWLSATIDPGQTPADHAEDGIDAAKVAAMTERGVNLLGLDQFDPNDGRVEASLWSWAPDQPAAGQDCAVQRADGRWISSDCTGVHPAACRTATGWVLTPALAVPAAAAACAARGATFDPPRTGEENAALKAAAAGAEPWLALPA